MNERSEPEFAFEYTGDDSLSQLLYQMAIVAINTRRRIAIFAAPAGFSDRSAADFSAELFRDSRFTVGLITPELSIDLPALLVLLSMVHSMEATYRRRLKSRQSVVNTTENHSISTVFTIDEATLLLRTLDPAKPKA